jgi:hypothetical protein
MRAWLETMLEEEGVEESESSEEIGEEVSEEKIEEPAEEDDPVFPQPAKSKALTLKRIGAALWMNGCVLLIKNLFWKSSKHRIKFGRYEAFSFYRLGERIVSHNPHSFYSFGHSRVSPKGEPSLFSGRKPCKSLFFT